MPTQWYSAQPYRWKNSKYSTLNEGLNGLNPSPRGGTHTGQTGSCTHPFIPTKRRLPRLTAVTIHTPYYHVIFHLALNYFQAQQHVF
jgi:hypothetical protein